MTGVADGSKSDYDFDRRFDDVVWALRILTGSLNRVSIASVTMYVHHNGSADGVFRQHQGEKVTGPEGTACVGMQGVHWLTTRRRPCCLRHLDRVGRLLSG